MRIFHCSVIFLFTFFLVSCAELQFPYFKIEKCNFNSNNVEVMFSNEPNQYLFVKNFSIKEDSNELSGVFSFSGSKVIFYPDDEIKDNYLYEVTISATAEDIYGNSLAEDYKTTYSTRNEFIRPSVLKISSEHESQLTSEITEIKIVFSEPIDDISFRNSLSFSPSFDYVYSWENDNSTVHIYPLSALSRETRYVVKLSTKLMDKNRNTLLNDFTSTFVNYLDNEKTDFVLSYEKDETCQNLIKETNNENIKTNEKLTLSFSEEINIEYISSYIEIYPSLNLTITPDKKSKQKASIEFTKDMNWGDTYRLTILHGLKDLFGNEIETDCYYDLTFNNEDNRPIKVKKVLIDLQNPAENYFEFKDFDSLSFEPLYYSTSDSNPVPTNIYFIFDISSNAEKIIDFSVMESFNIEFSNACFESITVKKVNILSESDIESDSKLKSVYDSISNIEGKLCVVLIGLEILNSTTSNVGTLKITMDKNIRDSLGNFMIDEYSCQVNKF